MIDRPLRATLLTAILLAAFLPGPSAGHDLRWTPTLLRLDPEEGVWELTITADLDALALGVASDADDAELRARLAGLTADERRGVRTRLESLLDRRVRVRFDGETVRPEEIRTPEEGNREDSWFGLEAHLAGRIPADAETVTVRLSRSFPPQILRVERPGSPTWHRLLEQGAASPELPVVEPLEARAPGTVLREYVGLGFLHILPRGLDHVLFVLCLFLLAPRWKPLLWQVSAFTLAHTVTLALATLDVVRLPTSVVEPLIALSIAVLALENLWTRELHAWRPAVVFVFGLLHGLGFAGVLGAVGLPDSALIPALVGFNVGVELGQLAVLGLAFAAVGWAREHPAYRRGVAIPASALIAIVGLYWTVERLGLLG